MRKTRICKLCKQPVNEEFCDTCGKEIEYPSIVVSYGYGSKKDGDEEHFCSDECYASKGACKK